jgi:tRNA(fMet)-specific endonuclease VapC
MTARLALDSNVVIQMFRAPSAAPPPQIIGRTIILPLPVVGELFAGAYGSERRDQNLSITESFVAKHAVLNPDEETARLYGRLRAAFRQALTTAKLNDLWIAAVCIQHDLPLLTNDRGFSAIPKLTVVDW